MNQTHESLLISKTVKKIFFMVLLSIIADQAVESVILETISPLDFSFGKITNAFLLSTMPFALILATWSDFHCRRKTMILALGCLTISAIFISIFRECNTNWILFSALAFKGIGGNVTPVALASLATIVPKRHFTLCLAVAICAYSVGLWVPIYLHSFEQLPLTATVIAVVSLVVVIFWFRESEFDNFKFQNNTASLRKFFSFLKKDIISIALFSVAVTVMLALLGYLGTEVSYYQILLRGEVLGVNPFYSDLSMKMAISYYIGTIALFIFIKLKVPDSKCLAIGVICSLLSIFLSSILTTYGVKSLITLDILFGFFSIGFSFLTPCLFSILSSIRRVDEQGKIYGFLDTYDTLGAYIAVKYIGNSQSASFNHSLWFSTIVIFISAIFILAFIRDIKERKINIS